MYLSAWMYMRYKRVVVDAITMMCGWTLMYPCVHFVLCMGVMPYGAVHWSGSDIAQLQVKEKWNLLPPIHTNTRTHAYPCSDTYTRTYQCRHTRPLYRCIRCPVAYHQNCARPRSVLLGRQLCLCSEETDIDHALLPGTGRPYGMSAIKHTRVCVYLYAYVSVYISVCENVEVCEC